jgi:acyl-CoA reductase-like NAD-dependent aldehyde dehydrogenase
MHINIFIFYGFIIYFYFYLVFVGQGVTSDGTPVKVDIRYTKLFINGEFVDSSSGKTYESINPATKQSICRISEAQAEDVDRAVTAARESFQSWSTCGPSKRSKLLCQLACLVERDIDEISGLEALDSGKTFSQAKHIDVQGLINVLRYWAGWADAKICAKTIESDPPYRVKTYHEPIGVVGAIIPCELANMMI